MLGFPLRGTARKKGAPARQDKTSLGTGTGRQELPLLKPNSLFDPFLPSAPPWTPSSLPSPRRMALGQPPLWLDDPPAEAGPSCRSRQTPGQQVPGDFRGNPPSKNNHTHCHSTSTYLLLTRHIISFNPHTVSGREGLLSHPSSFSSIESQVCLIQGPTELSFKHRPLSPSL